MQNSRESEKECLQFHAAEISYVTGIRSIVVWLVFHALCVWPLAALWVFHRKGSFNAGKTIIGADCTRRFCLQSSLLHSSNDCCKHLNAITRVQGSVCEHLFQWVGVSIEISLLLIYKSTNISMLLNRIMYSITR